MSKATVIRVRAQAHPTMVTVEDASGEVRYYACVHNHGKVRHGGSIVGHYTCGACGEIVRMRDRFCWNCGSMV